MPGEQMDMGAALAEISSGLGFASSSGDDNGNSGNDALGGQAEGAGGRAADAGSHDAAGGEPALDAQPEGAAGEGNGDGPADAAATPDPDAAPDADAAADDAAAAAGRQPPDITKPPKSWKAGPAGEWASLSESTRQEIHRREEDFYRGIEGYKANAAVGRDFHSVMQPFLPILQHFNIDPYQQVRGLMEAHQTLALGSAEQKTELFQRLAKDYGVDLRTVAGSGEPAGEAPYEDPQVAALREKTASLESTVEQMTAAQRQTRAAELNSKINAFSADPKNVYFKDLANDMAALIRGGVAQTLEDAYQKALWQNPVVRAKELARQQSERAAAEEKARLEKLEKAKKAAGANLPNGRPGGKTAPTGTMDDTLQETLARIKERG